MNGSLGRDKVWNQQIWSDIDKAVQEEVGRIRVAQKVFPSTVVNNVLPVSMKRVGPPGFILPPPGPTPDVFQPFFEISTEFVLTQAEVDGEENVHLATSFARSAASVIANAEDRIVFSGPALIAFLLAMGVNVTNPLAVPPGFVAEAANYLPLPPPLPWYAVANILTAIADGKGRLNARNQPGPYALFLSPTRYAQTFAQPAAGLLQTPGDQIPHVVTGGFYMVNGLPTGILVSLGGEPTKIILGTDAIAAFTHTDALGNCHFRVFERIQLVVRDGRAFQTLRVF
jgi:uncharacterized linocin/CFP29 family protein